uniref:Uncharacterized protein n=1 Tax=viral metagenome TaxID=1070528 RepID=A0A6M3J3L7_9ZZZZ
MPYKAGEEKPLPKKVRSSPLMSRSQIKFDLGGGYYARDYMPLPEGDSKSVPTYFAPSEPAPSSSKPRRVPRRSLSPMQEALCDKVEKELNQAVDRVDEAHIDVLKQESECSSLKMKLDSAFDARMSSHFVDPMRKDFEQCTNVLETKKGEEQQRHKVFSELERKRAEWCE